MTKILIFCLFPLLLMNCSNSDAHEQTEADTLKIHYSVVSKGSKYSIIIDQEEIVINREGFKNSITSKEINKAVWKELQRLVDEIDLEELKTLKAPTGNRAIDVTGHAQLKIEKGGKVYEAATFDEGFPAKKISLLIKAIVTLTETVE